MDAETKARKLVVCPACGKPKTLGCIVCWECFKYGNNPFKWANMSLINWLKTIPANQKAEIARSKLNRL